MHFWVNFWQSFLSGEWDIALSSPAEWVATALSVYGFYWCIRKRPGSFIIFLIADATWLTTALAHQHWSLVAQQTVYLLMDITGYWIWLRQQRAENRVKDYQRSLEDEVMVLSAKLEIMNEHHDVADDKSDKALTSKANYQR